LKKIALAQIAIALSVLLASCGSIVVQGYEGAARPESETALVRVLTQSELTRGSMVWLRPAFSAQIVSVDSSRGDRISTPARVLRLLPGETCLGIEASFTSGSIEHDICFEPLANHSYELEMGFRVETGIDDVVYRASNLHALFIRDVATGEIVSYSDIPP